MLENTQNIREKLVELIGMEENIAEVLAEHRGFVTQQRRLYLESLMAEESGKLMDELGPSYREALAHILDSPRSHSITGRKTELSKEELVRRRDILVLSLLDVSYPQMVEMGFTAGRSKTIRDIISVKQQLVEYWVQEKARRQGLNISLHYRDENSNNGVRFELAGCKRKFMTVQKKFVEPLRGFYPLVLSDDGIDGPGLEAQLNICIFNWQKRRNYVDGLKTLENLGTTQIYHFDPPSRKRSATDDSGNDDTQYLTSDPGVVVADGSYNGWFVYTQSGFKDLVSKYKERKDNNFVNVRKSPDELVTPLSRFRDLLPAAVPDYGESYDQ